MRAPERRRFAPRWAAACSLLAALCGGGLGVTVLLSGLLGSVEQSSLAARFALRPHGHPAGVVVVGIDDRSFSQLRHSWPFPRSWHGTVLRRLRAAGARGVFYDLQFTEPTTPAQDLALYDALGATGGAVLATTDADHGHSNVLGGDANLARVDSRAAVAFLPVGPGGVIDRFPYAQGGLSGAAVAMVSRLWGHPPVRGAFSDGGAYIDYQGPPRTIPTLSFADVLRGRFDPRMVRGKVVVVGPTAPTFQDQHPTPTSGSDLMSGPEIQANAIWTLLHGVPLRPLGVPWALALVLLLAALPPVVRLRRSAPAAALSSLLTAALYALATQAAFDGGVVLPVVGPLVALGGAAVLTLIGSHVLVTRELRATQLEVVQRLGRAAESRDGDTGRHLERMAHITEALALAVGLPRREARLLSQASALHDVGKIGIPDEVLLKSGRFTPGDRTIMETHAVRGAAMLAGSTTGMIQLAEEMALTHHEHWDGTGYPHGLAGDEIPLSGRICAICDVFDALISRRRYKESWSLEATLAALEEGAGSHFDPRLAQAFLRIAPRLYRELTESVDPGLASAPSRGSLRLRGLRPLRHLLGRIG